MEDSTQGADAPLDRATAAAWTRTWLEQSFDGLLSAEGFTRSAKAIGYVRTVPAGKQRIDFFLTMRPKWAKDSVVLSLNAVLLMPEVATTAENVLGKATLGSRKWRGLVDNQLLETLVRNPSPMTFREPADLDRYVPSMEGHLRERVLPYLDARRTVRGFAECGGFRGGSPIYGAAAFLVLGERDRAREFMEAAYPPNSPYRANHAVAYAALADDPADP